MRRRLTHSLEVSTVVRDVGRAIGRWLGKENIVDEEQAKALETIAATCGLIHDLGNPPFGHAGETAIKEWFKNKLKKDKKFFNDIGGEKRQYAQDFLNFESNAQTLRLISKLQVLSDLYGLNFTCATMSAACKYTVPSHKINKKYHEKAKVGYFASEANLIDLVREQTGTGEARNPITFIVEACDDIVYSVVDLEDGVRKNVFDWKTLKDKLEKHAGKDNNILKKCFEKAKWMIEKKPGAIKLEGGSRDEAMSQAFRVFAIGELVSAAIETFKDKYKKIMKGHYHGELVHDSRAASLIEACKDIGIEDVYCAKQNLRLEVMGRHIINGLMDIFWEGAWERANDNKPFADKIFNLMSKNYIIVFEYAEKSDLPKKYCCMQLVTDYICGMTDTFACTLHKQLTNG